MKTYIWMVVALLCSSSAARADTESDWSLGAGLGYGFGSISTLQPAVSGYVGYSYYSPVTFTGAGTFPSASLEHRIGEGTWLLICVNGNISRTTAVAPATQFANSTYVTASTAAGGALALGLRRYLTSPGAVVGVSIDGALDVGVQSVGVDYTTLDENSVASSAHASGVAWNLGAFGGIALDKSLTERLSLRLAVQLLSINYSKLTTSPSSIDGAGSSFGASLIFEPDLELRMAF